MITILCYMVSAFVILVFINLVVVIFINIKRIRANAKKSLEAAEKAAENKK